MRQPAAVVLSALFLLLLSPAVFAAGIGVSPSEVAFKDVLYGGYAERLVTVSNPDNVAKSYAITVEGQVAPWMYFNPGVTFSVPALGSKQVIFIISPPDDTSSGTYEGTVTIVALQASQPSSKYGMGVSAGARISVTITVTGQKKTDYEIISIKGGASSGEEGSSGSKFKFTIDMINKGNVKITPHVHVDVWDRDQTKIVKSADFEGEDLLPTKLGTQEYEILTKDLPEGQYWADITVTIDGKVVRQQLLTFDVYESEELPIGEIVDVFHKVRLYADEVARVDFVFENRGSITTSAIFRGSIFFKEQSIEDVESEEVTASPGESVNLTVFFQPTQTGQYIIKGKAFYSDKITYPVDAVINVVSEKPSTPATGLFLDPTNFWVIIAVIILIGYLIYRYKTR